jgi:hypothetical protein
MLKLGKRPRNPTLDLLRNLHSHALVAGLKFQLGI